MTLATPLAPRVPSGPLRVLIFGRNAHRAESLADQFAACEAVLHEVYRGPTEVRRLGNQTMHEAEDAIDAGE